MEENQSDVKTPKEGGGLLKEKKRAIGSGTGPKGPTNPRGTENTERLMELNLRSARREGGNKKNQRGN